MTKHRGFRNKGPISKLIEPSYVWAPYIPLQMNPCFEQRKYPMVDRLVQGQMYRVVQDEGFSPHLYKRPEVDNSAARIGRVNPGQVVQYLDIVKCDSELTIAAWYYKLFAGDQVGYVYGPNISLDPVQDNEEEEEEKL